MKNTGICMIFYIFFFLTPLYNSFAADIKLETIKLPEGFKIEVLADNLVTAREIAVSPKGIMYVGSKEGNVYALEDRNFDLKIERKYIIARGLNMPVGVEYYKGDLYISEINRILRLDSIDNSLANPPRPVVVIDNLPGKKHHGWKFIEIGPDNKLYIPSGVPCNVCLADEGYGVILRMNLDGTGLEVFAEGVRNSVGFDWHPLTNVLWFTDNGRDRMGDDLPPDELNRAPERGLHFGFPYIHGTIADPEFGKVKPPGKYENPAQELGPHVAALGMRFYRGSMFPEQYRNQIFIAEHGSWNRSVPIGYRITLVRLKGTKAVSYEVFAEGWLEANGKSWGRPADVAVAYDGSLLVSDDKANAVYRIYYEN